MSRFKLQHQITELKLRQPFTIARGTKNSVRNVIVTLGADGRRGYGEADPNKRYNEDAETVTAFINGLPNSFFDNIERAEQLAEKLNEHSAKSVQSAKSAVEMAWLDRWGKSQGQPLWKLWNAPSPKTPPTSYTIGLDEIEVMQEKVKAAKDFPILKVKLGTNRDREIIKGIREISDQTIRVDANEGWESLTTAKEQISFLADHNIEIVEQPMPATMKDEMRKLKQWSPLPLMADESFMGSEKLEDVAHIFDGINIKLSKIGSLVKARKVIEKARSYDLQVMIGCMIASSLSMSAGALIGTWADYVDLDGFLLIEDDPFEGLTLTEDKKIVLAESPGLAVQPKD